MTHFEQRLESDLGRIRDEVWALGQSVEDAVRNAKKVLILRDEVLAYATVLADHPINQRSRECDRMCHQFIARYLPSAGHLRTMAATIRVNVALERIGDYAVTISREALQLTQPLPAAFAQDMDEVADESLNILAQSREAFRDGKADTAVALMKLARQVQSQMDHIYLNLAEADDDLDGISMMAIFMVFSMFKRVADQAKNICDQTVYAVQGINKIPKIHKVLFLDRIDSGAGQLAAAIGRKHFSSVAEFQVATPGRSDVLPTDLRSFLDGKGLPDAGLDTEPLEALELDIGDYSLIVSVNGDYHDYLEKVPFHSSALNWTIEGLPPALDRTAQYRSLVERVENLMHLVAGEHL